VLSLKPNELLTVTQIQFPIERTESPQLLAEFLHFRSLLGGWIILESHHLDH
jgi:hypothetical protein